MILFILKDPMSYFHKYNIDISLCRDTEADQKVEEDVIRCEINFLENLEKDTFEKDGDYSCEEADNHNIRASFAHSEYIQSSTDVGGLTSTTYEENYIYGPPASIDPQSLNIAFTNYTALSLPSITRPVHIGYFPEEELAARILGKNGHWIKMITEDTDAHYIWFSSAQKKFHIWGDRLILPGVIVALHYHFYKTISKFVKYGFDNQPDEFKGHLFTQDEYAQLWGPHSECFNWVSLIRHYYGMDNNLISSDKFYSSVKPQTICHCDLINMMSSKILQKQPVISPNKLSLDRIQEFSKIFSKIRVKPAAMKDRLIITEISDQTVLIDDTTPPNKDRKEVSSISPIEHQIYGSSHKKFAKWVSPEDSDKPQGVQFGQDFILYSNKTFILADGHGSGGERLSCYMSHKVSDIIDRDQLLQYLKEEHFSGIIQYILSQFVTLEKKSADICRHTKKASGEYYQTIAQRRSCDRNLYISPNAGTTLNYSTIISIPIENKADKRYIVTANVGDSETYVVCRYPDGKTRIKLMSGCHSAENINEAQRVLDKLGQTEYSKHQPIYSRWGVYNHRQGKYIPIPQEIANQLGYFDSKTPVYRKYPIFNISATGKKLTVNEELLHKIHMACGKYGEKYQVLNWYGGIQSIRANVIEKQEKGLWKPCRPIPGEPPTNFGSSMYGETQSTRGFGDFRNWKYQSSKPHISIYEIPSEVHATLITSSDGFGDTVYLSEVSDEIQKSPFGEPGHSNKMKDNLVELMYRKCSISANDGLNWNAAGQPIWDDVCFGLMDSPPNVLRQNCQS
tara:strand:- start:1474 stop:3852 length:2379 start_codon:yes stop_codon:yes gene_type:complete